MLLLFGSLFGQWNLVGFFNSSHSLRQGDPISLFLFVIVIDALSRVLEVMVGTGFLSSFLVGCMNNRSLLMCPIFFLHITNYYFAIQNWVTFS